MKTVAAILGVLLAACTGPGDAADPAEPSTVGAGPAGAEDAPCGPGAEMEIGYGLIGWLPIGTTVVETAQTDDTPPHAEAGATLDVDGTTIEVWRVLGDNVGPSASVDLRVDPDAAIWVRSRDAGLRQCVLAGITYDSSRDGT